MESGVVWVCASRGRYRAVVGAEDVLCEQGYCS